MVHLAWLCVTYLSCGSSGLVVLTDLSCVSSDLVVCDRSELWFIRPGCV